MEAKPYLRFSHAGVVATQLLNFLIKEVSDECSRQHNRSGKVQALQLSIDTTEKRGLMYFRDDAGACVAVPVSEL